MVNRRILAVRLDSMGDLLVTGPALRALAAAPDVAGLTLLCSPEAAPTARLLPGVSAVIAWSCPWIVSPAPAVDRGDIDALVHGIAAADIDEAVVFTSFHQSPLPVAMLLRLAGITRITGVSTDYAGSLLDVRIRPSEASSAAEPSAGGLCELSDDLPEVERALAIAALAGFPLPAGDDGRPQVTGFTGALERQCPPAAALTAAGTVIVVHPGASVPARRWAPEHLRATVGLLAAEGWTPVVTGSPSERDLTASVAGHEALDLGGRLDVRGLADLLSRSRAVIVGNTGPAHLAAAVGTPVVSLFSPVVPPRRWLPYGVDVEMLGDQRAPCRGTRARECPVPGHPCLDSVDAAEAVAALHRLLDRAEDARSTAPRPFAHTDPAPGPRTPTTLNAHH